MNQSISLKEKITGFSKLGFDYWFFFLVVLALGRSTSFICNFDPRTEPISFVVLLLFCIKLLKKTKNFRKTANYGLIMIPLLIWTIYHMFEDFAFQYGSYAQFAIKIFVGLLFAVYYQDRLLEYFGKIIVCLSAISIPFWVLNNIIGAQNLALFAPFEQWLGEGSSFLVYTTLENLDYSSERAQMLYGNIVRNPGFCWEPGRFASSIVLGMVCYIICNKGKIEWKSWQWLSLLIALLTTQSTTGYVAFLVMLALHYTSNTNISSNKKIFGVIFVSIIASYAMTLPFMREKIIENADSNSWVTENKISEWIERGDRVVTVDRSEGLYLDYLNLKYKPIMGTGLAHRDSYIYNFISQNLATSNGILSPLSKLGLLLGIPYFLLFYFGTKRISKFHSRSEVSLLFWVAVIFQYSYNYMFEILFFALSFFAIIKIPDCEYQQE